MGRMMKELKCPICDRLFSEENPDVAMPFCSPRCKLVDAGRWLGESYGLPIEIEDDENLSPQEAGA